VLAEARANGIAPLTKGLMRYVEKQRLTMRTKPIRKMTPEEMADELVVLREIVKQLPRTADGVVIVPGMKLHPLQPIPPEELDGDDDCTEVRFVATDEFSGDEIEAEDFPMNYSSKAAAEKARVERQLK
jgi:hypothetical protein